MYRLEPVAHVGQRPRYDDAHGVVEIRRLHFDVDVDLADGSEFHETFPCLTIAKHQTRMDLVKMTYSGVNQ